MKKTVLVILISLLVLYTSRAFSGHLYGVYDDDYHIYQIDPVNMSVTSVLSINKQLSALAFNSDDGFLYGGMDNDNYIYRIDPVNMSVTSTAYLGYKQLSGLAYNSDDGYLYGVYDDDYHIYQIDPVDMSVASVLSIDKQLSALAFNSDDGFLYGGMDNDNYIYRIDPVNMSVTSTAYLGYKQLSGLAYVPEPCTLLLLAAGTIAVRRRHRRQHTHRSVTPLA